MIADRHVVEGMTTGGNVADELTAEVAGCHVVADKGYDGDRYRDQPRSNNDAPVLPGRRNRKDIIGYDKSVDELRRNIELFFGKPRRTSVGRDAAPARRRSPRSPTPGSKPPGVGDRGEKRQRFLGFVALAAIKIAIRPYL